LPLHTFGGRRSVVLRGMCELIVNLSDNELAVGKVFAVDDGSRLICAYPALLKMAAGLDKLSRAEGSLPLFQEGWLSSLPIDEVQLRLTGVVRDWRVKIMCDDREWPDDDDALGLISKTLYALGATSDAVDSMLSAERQTLCRAKKRRAAARKQSHG
jgi:hypothetical protein